jgi:hypothetical protein
LRNMEEKDDKSVPSRTVVVGERRETPRYFL